MIKQISMMGYKGTVEEVGTNKYKVKIDNHEETFQLPQLSNADWNESYSQAAEEVVFAKMVMVLEKN